MKAPTLTRLAAVGTTTTRQMYCTKGLTMTKMWKPACQRPGDACRSIQAGWADLAVRSATWASSDDKFCRGRQTQKCPVLGLSYL